jgi:MFS transporter
VSRFRAGPLGVPAFRFLAGGQFASTIGDYCYAVALPWFVLSNHGSTVLLGVVLACYGIPRTVLIPLGGVLSDKIGPRTLMLGADAVRCVLVAVLALLAVRHNVSLVTLGPIAACIGAGEGLFLPASYAIMPSLLHDDLLGAGNALSSAAVQLGSLIGPALGGALVATTRASTAAFAVDAVSFAISALTLKLIPASEREGAVLSGPASEREGAVLSGPASEREGAVLSGLRSDEGATREDSTQKRPEASEPINRASEPANSVLTVLRQSRALQVIMVVVIAANLSGGGVGEVALPALAHARWGASGYGALLACQAAGAVLGTLAATRTGGLRKPAVFASVAFLIDAVSVCLVPHLGGVAGAAVALFVLGAFNGLGNVVFLTVAQRQIPPALLGRMMGVMMLCAFGTFPISVAVAGVLVRHIGPVPFFPIAGAIIAAAMLGGLTQRDFRDFGARDTAAGREPQAVMR